MLRVSVIGALFTMAAAGTAAAAMPTTVSSLGLNGSYTCTAGSKTFTTTWSPVLGGTWLRADNGRVENSVTLDKSAHVWRVTSIDAHGGTMIWQAPATSADRAVLQEVYPRHGSTTTFQHVSPVKYTLTYDETANGKAMHSVTTCTKT